VGNDCEASSGVFVVVNFCSLKRIYTGRIQSGRKTRQSWLACASLVDPLLSSKQKHTPLRPVILASVTILSIPFLIIFPLARAIKFCWDVMSGKHKMSPLLAVTFWEHKYCIVGQTKWWKAVAEWPSILCMPGGWDVCLMYAN
jgi:hypothetical protein